MKRYRVPVLRSAGRGVVVLLLAMGVWGLVACGSSSKNGTGEPDAFVFDKDTMVDAAGYGVSALGTFDAISLFVALIVELLEPPQELEALDPAVRLTPLQITQPVPCITGDSFLDYDVLLADNMEARLSFDKCKLDPDPEYFILDGEVLLRVSRYNAQAGPNEPFLQGSLTINVAYDELIRSGDSSEEQREQGNFSSQSLPLLGFRGPVSMRFQYGLGGQNVLFTGRQTEPSPATTLEFGCFDISVSFFADEGDLQLTRAEGYSAVAVNNLAFSVSGQLDFETFAGQFDEEPVPRGGRLDYQSSLGRGPCRALRAPEGITPAPTTMRLFPDEEAPFMVLELYPSGFGQSKDETATKRISWFSID